MSMIVMLCVTFFGELPEFHEPVMIQADGVNIDVGYVADPFTVDWDGDDDLDLIVGQFTSGKISLFLNNGTGTAPLFTFDSFLQAGGSEITLSYG
ncbi:MAG: hypothetical protein JXA64_02125 [Candidatus Fermentibacteraceae bacterium]|nr:hypothetical protein [Candidatus Fermentibacteraceae bacterium]